MKSLIKFLNLPHLEKKLFCQVLLTVCVIRAGLWVLPFKWVKRYLAINNSAKSQDDSADWIVITSVTNKVKTCSRFVPYATCLTQALTTHSVLNRQGASSELKIGVAKDGNGKFEAHAWLEVNGKIIIGKIPRHQRFAVLDSSNLAVL